MPLIETEAIMPREPKPGWHGRFFGTESMTFAYYTIDAGASLHEHSHPNEEVWNVLSGVLEITIGSESFRAGTGAVAIVPPNTAHSVRALEASAVIVVDEGRRGEMGGGVRAALSVEIRARTPAAIELEIVNHGREHGVLREIAIEIGAEGEPPLPVRTEIPRGELFERTPIAGLDTLRREHATTGGPVSFVRGAIFYEDARGELHHTTFCRVFDASGDFVPPSRPGYNYGD